MHRNELLLGVQVLNLTAQLLCGTNGLQVESPGPVTDMHNLQKQLQGENHGERFIRDMVEQWQVACCSMCLIPQICRDKVPLL